MYLFHQRPIAFAACLYALFAILATKLSLTLHLVLLVIAGCLLAGLLLFRFYKKHLGKYGIVTLLCLFATVLSLGTSYGFFKIQYADLQSLVGKNCIAEGLVTERLSGDSYYSRFRAEIDRLNGEDTAFGALLECEYSSPLQPGDRFVLQTVPREFRSDEYFDEESYTLSDGCMLILVSSDGADCEILGNESTSFSVLASRTNLSFSYDLYRATNGGGLVSRLLLGNGTFLSKNDQVCFSYTGGSHLLALSGLHVSILIGFMEFILRRLRLPRVGRAILIPIAALGYLILTGCPVSAMRAVFMVCILYLAYLWRGEYDPFTALSVALVLILQITPYAVYDTSLWLSFTAAGSIIVFMPFIQTLLDAWREKTKLPQSVFRIVRSLVTAVSVGVIVNIALLPLSAAVFGEISLWSVPVTLLFSIPVALILIFGILMLLFPFVPYLGELCGAIESWMLETVRVLSEAENCLISLSDTGCVISLILLTVSLILLAVLPFKKVFGWVTVCALCIATAGALFFGVYSPSSQEWNHHVLEYSRGDVCVYTCERRAVVVNHTFGAVNAAYDIEQLVNQERCTEIDSLIFEDIYQQAPYFLCKLSDRMLVRTLHLPTPKDAREAAIAERICIDAERYGIDVVFDGEEQLKLYEKEENS